MKIIFHKVIIFILFLVYLPLNASIPTKDISDTVMNFYMSSFNVDKSDIHLRIIHFPNTERFTEETYRLKVKSNSIVPGLGHQSLKLLVFKDDILIKKFGD